MLSEKSLHFYYNNLDLTKLSFIRGSKGYSKKFLAELLGKTPSTITQYESGKSGMSFETFQLFVEKLHVHPATLTSCMNIPSHTPCHFRANKKVSQLEREKATSQASIVHKIFSYFEKFYGIIFPEQTFESLEKPTYASENAINNCAVQFRQSIGLGLGPIANMANLVESLGIRVILLEKTNENIRLDGFATWIEGLPYIIVDGSSPASRMQFDYAHELAHILFDEDSVPEETSTEIRANSFAGSLLMPYQTFYDDCPMSYSKNNFLSVKKYWHVSIQAALFRGKQIGKISERNYKNAVIGFSKYRKNEPGESFLTRPTPILLTQALEAALSDGFDIYHMSEALALLPKQIYDILIVQSVPTDLANKIMTTVSKAQVMQFKPEIKKSYI